MLSKVLLFDMDINHKKLISAIWEKFPFRDMKDKRYNSHIQRKLRTKVPEEIGADDDQRISANYSINRHADGGIHQVNTSHVVFRSSNTNVFFMLTSSQMPYVGVLQKVHVLQFPFT